MRIEPIRPSFYKITAPFEGGGVSYLYLLKGDTVALVDTCVADTPEQVLVLSGPAAPGAATALPLGCPAAR